MNDSKQINELLLLKRLELDSPCRNSTNVVSYYLTELDGVGLLCKIAIVLLYLMKIKRVKNKLELVLVIIIGIHAFIHMLILLASLPPFCDSSNNSWKPDESTMIGKLFNFHNCHKKHELYYSQKFWLTGSVSPLLLLLLVLYNSKYKLKL